MKKILCIGFVLLFCISPLFAQKIPQNVKNKISVHTSDDLIAYTFNNVYKSLLDKCSKTDKQSCIDIGDKYMEYGEYTSAMKFYNEACIADFLLGCVKLGSLFENGNGVRYDPEKAIEMFEKTCKREDGISCNDIGYRYEKGVTFSKDQQEALKYYMQSCDMKYATGCMNVGRLYLVGRGGIEQNVGKAREYYRQACSLGSAQACDEQTDLYITAEKYADADVSLNGFFLGVEGGFKSFSPSMSPGGGIVFGYQKFFYTDHVFGHGMRVIARGNYFYSAYNRTGEAGWTSVWETRRSVYGLLGVDYLFAIRPNSSTSIGFFMGASIGYRYLMAIDRDNYITGRPIIAEWGSGDVGVYPRVGLSFTFSQIHRFEIDGGFTKWNTSKIGLRYIHLF